MIDPKLNIRHSPQSDAPAKENFPAAHAHSAVQARAYEIYEQRGGFDGNAEKDWYEAEADITARSGTR